MAESRNDLSLKEMLLRRKREMSDEGFVLRFLLQGKEKQLLQMEKLLNLALKYFLSGNEKKALKLLTILASLEKSLLKGI